MDAARYAEICRHFEVAVALEGSDQKEYLDRLGQQDPSLLKEVQEMLRNDGEAEQANFLEECVPGYSQLTPISRGGQGTVYRAKQNRTGQYVALKIVETKKWETSDESRFQHAIDDFAREIKTIATLRHPNIVRIYDAGECSSGQFFAMELIEGGTLADVKHQISHHEIARTIQLMAEALTEAHANGVLHLDIKPQNILFDKQLDQPFLTDFGLARLAHVDATPDRIVGTLAYMAPEQFNSGHVDERTDVYGLGATLFYLLTGRPVRQSSSIDEAREQDRSLDPDNLKQELTGVNRELARICRRCLESDPGKRYQTAGELARELERFRETEDVQHLARGGTMTLKWSWALFVINAVVYGMVRTGFTDRSIAGEVLTWFSLFTMYLVVFSQFYFAPYDIQLERGRLTIEFLWSIWIAKMLAAIFISISMRIGPAESASEAILLSYPMFAALSGMALCSMAPRFWRALYLFAAGMWIVGIVIMFTLSLGWQIAPLIYGACSSLGVAGWGIYLRSLASNQPEVVKQSAILGSDSEVRRQKTVLMDS